MFSLDIPHIVVVALKEKKAFIVPRQRFNGRVCAKGKKKAFLLLAYSVSNIIVCNLVCQTLSTVFSCKWGFPSLELLRLKFPC